MRAAHHQPSELRGPEHQDNGAVPRAEEDLRKPQSQISSSAAGDSSHASRHQLLIETSSTKGRAN